MAQSYRIASFIDNRGEKFINFALVSRYASRFACFFRHANCHPLLTSDRRHAGLREAPANYDQHQKTENCNERAIVKNIPMDYCGLTP